MTDDAPPELQGTGAGEVAAPQSTGAILAQAREAAGLSIEDVAVQLKLAPRQVVASERDDFASLPGRTFVRGFVRNYARLLKLDVDAALAALEDDDYGRLPGRTFVRGFVRNYARLVHLDAERVVAALPGGEQPALAAGGGGTSSAASGSSCSVTRRPRRSRASRRCSASGS